jgi:signal transduction histidine kinase
LRLVLSEIQHLSRLIDNLFELSQIDSGALRLHTAELDVAELVAQTLAAYEAPAAERGVRMERELAHARMQGDAERLQRVLRNLLDNALRHTPSGGTISVATISADTQVELRISDSGGGVAADDLEKIFDRFYRGERSRRREDTSGAGLGLAIARGIVNAHDGRIWAESSPLGGVCMRIVLPALTRTAAASAARSTPGPTHASRP